MSEGDDLRPEDPFNEHGGSAGYPDFPENQYPPEPTWEEAQAVFRTRFEIEIGMTLQLFRVSLKDGSRSSVGTAESLGAADKLLSKLAIKEAKATNAEAQAVRSKDGYRVVLEPDHLALYTFEAPLF